MPQEATGAGQDPFLRGLFGLALVIASTALIPWSVMPGGDWRGMGIPSVITVMLGIAAAAGLLLRIRARRTSGRSHRVAAAPALLLVTTARTGGPAQAPSDARGRSTPRGPQERAPAGAPAAGKADLAANGET